MNATYLSHIDGLRAIALMGVLLFHFEVFPFKGGFVGVDIFLTISGYLITRNILLNHSRKSPFSLREFYTRRFCRLFPAATITVLLAVVASVAIFPNGLIKETAESGLAAMLVSANTYFYLKSGYFDSSSTVKPLLHMWSLSLEEQFYLLWAPLILLQFTFFPSQSVISRMKVTLAILTVISVICSAYFARYTPSFAFFHLPSRIFQFSIGAGLAVYQKENETEDTDDAEEPPVSVELQKVWSMWFLGTTFAALVLVTSFIFIPEGSPSFAVLPVNVATTLLLAYPNAPVCTRILSSTLFIFLGSLSYSAYLVHWPLYVYSRFVLLAIGASKPHPLVMTLSTILLAVLLKFAIEDPIRKGGRSRRATFGGIVLITLYICYKTCKIQDHVADEAKESIESEAAKFLFGNINMAKESLSETESPIVTHGKQVLSRISRTGDIDASTEPAMTFFGNSFTGHLVPALYLIGMRRKVWFRLYIAASCGIYAPSMWYKIKPEYRNCGKFNKVMWDAIDELPPNSTVVLAKLWGLTSADALIRRVKPIAEELRKRNLKPVFLEEPPGLDEGYESYYDCDELRNKPIGRILLLKKNGIPCGFDFQQGAHALGNRLQAHSAYTEVFPEHVPEIKFLSVMEEICDVTRDELNKSVKAICRVPTHSLLSRFPGLTDPGYKRDLRHLSLLGSAALSHTYEKLFGNYL